MKKKVIDKVKNIFLKNKKKVKIAGLVFLVIIAVVIFGFSFLGKNVSNFVAEKIYSNKVQKNPNISIAVDENFISDDSTNKKSDLVIGAMSDSHAEGKIYSMIAKFAKEVHIQEKGERNPEKPDFIIELGDFIENRNIDGNGKQPRAEGIAEWKIADDSLLGFQPRYHVIGNHEMFSLYKKDYKELTGFDSYYSFVAKNYQIIVLDANYWFDTGEDVERGKEKLGAYEGFIPDKEKKWLEEKLQENNRNIIFVHHPLYGLFNSIEIEELLSKYKDRVVLIVSGHKHIARSSTFAGISYIDTPSLNIKKQYVIIKVKDNKSEVEFINL